VPLVYRLVRKKHAKPADLLSGAGAALLGGRWNEKGTRSIYASSHVSLVVLESLVHADTLPKDMVLVSLDIPDDVAIRRWRPKSLPRSWADYPFGTATQKRGTAWAKRRKELAVWVPSAVVPSEWNCLLNPMHVDIARVKAKLVARFRFDPRLRTAG
jgi:RES domain-containing protein